MSVRCTLLQTPHQTEFLRPACTSRSGTCQWQLQTTPRPLPGGSEAANPCFPAGISPRAAGAAKRSRRTGRRPLGCERCSLEFTWPGAASATADDQSEFRGVPGRREDSENQKSSLVGIACRLRSNLRSSGEGRVRERRSRQGAKRTRLSARGDAQGQCHGRGGEAGFAKREKCECCASADDVVACYRCTVRQRSGDSSRRPGWLGWPESPLAGRTGECRGAAQPRTAGAR